jgi:hypothetical protein
MVQSIPLILNPSKPPQVVETMSERIVRKSKEQPLVPLGVLATTVALTTAFYKQRRGNSKDMNVWLRARVVFQGLTVVALLAGSYAMGQTPAQQREAAEKENERLLSLAAREREEFEKRMRLAEEAHAEETEVNSVRARRLGMDNPSKKITDWKEQDKVHGQAIVGSEPPSNSEGKRRGIFGRLRELLIGGSK